MNRLAKILTAILIPALLTVAGGFLYGCNSHTHTVEFVAGKAATCSVEGIIDHWHCTECGENFKDPGAQNKLSTVVMSTAPHRFVGGYSFNSEQHYNTCYECGYIDTHSMNDHMLSYKGDDEDHFFTCYCGYEGEHEPHYPNSGGNPCETCGYGGITYKLSSKGDYYICTGVSSSYIEHIEELIIPATYNKLPVKEIGERAFQYCTALKKVVLGANVISVGAYAFMDCSALTDLQLNNGLMEIQASAFIDCVSLEQVTLPKSIVTLSNGVFQGCTGIKRIVIPSSITGISRQTFYNCRSLEEVVLPSTLKSIDTAAFANTAIKSIVFPNGLTELPMTVFLACPELTTVTLPATIKKINAAAFSGCISLKEINFLGTEAQWSEVEFINVPQAWDFGTPTYTVNCLG